MKVNKVLKKLAKIEAWISDVTERYSTKGALHVQEAFQDAKAALDRVKVAVSAKASSKRVKTPRVKREKTAFKRKASVKKATAKTAVALAAPAIVKKTSRSSAAQKKKQTERMKAFWAAKRKAQAKSQPTTASTPKKTVPPAVKTLAAAQSAVPLTARKPMPAPSGK